MSNGPLPTTLIFLSDLPTIPTGSKVRFLGCVTHNPLSSTTLSLQHAHGTSKDGNVTALVNVDLLLEGLKREDTEVGAWVNIIGYVEDVVGQGNKDSNPNGREEGGDVRVNVKAVMLWNAGGVRIEQYEKVLQERLQVSSGDRA